jgi:hypothetical protein
LLCCCAWTLWLVVACVIMLGAQRYVLLVLGTKLLIYLVCICLYFPLQSNHLSIYHTCLLLYITRVCLTNVGININVLS